MSHRMKGKDIVAASSALVDWLESQEIDPDDAVLVMTTTLVGVIYQLAKKHGGDAKVGGKIIADIIMESLP